MSKAQYSNMISGYLADMRTPTGETVRRESETAATRTALKLALQVAETPFYQRLAALLPEPQVALYFEKVLKDSIYPAIRELCMARWQMDNGASSEPRDVVWRGHPGLGRLLQPVWPSRDIPLKLGARKRSDVTLRAALARLYRKSLTLVRRWRRVAKHRPSLALPVGRGPTIAVRYSEGLDPARRSDLFWYPFSGVDPGRILILFDYRPSIHKGNRVPLSVTRDIEARGMKWVGVANELVEDAGVLPWKPPPSIDSLVIQFRRGLGQPANTAERWLAETSGWLLQEVDYWKAFYGQFKVKAHLEAGNGATKQIAQNIALDLLGGVKVGYQRSEFGTEEGGVLGHNPDRVCFVWSARSKSDLDRNRDRVDSVSISGFPYGRDWRNTGETDALRRQLKQAQSGIVVALFDSAFWWGGTYSKEMVLSFYSAFLEWLLEDPGVAVINKSKKRSPLEQLPEIQALMDRAEATGRWVSLSDPQGRLPSDASLAADLSVGLGISTAVNEAVALGGRGVHCDLTGMCSHSYYAWGHNKVVFDDLDQMMAAFKRYKADPASEPELGDFSQMMDQVDPFHDGRGNERIGNYIGWLLEGFDSGLHRDEAVKRANEKYAGIWGEEMVLATGAQAPMSAKAS